MSETIGVIGGGPWGVALARAAARSGATTVLFSRRETEKDGRLLTITQSYERVAQARVLVLAVPSYVLRDVARSLGEHLDGTHLVVHGVRGLGARLETMSDILRQETPVRRLGALGGPVQANELLEGKPSAMVVGSPYPEVGQAITDAFQSEWMRVYSISDIRGLEWASALVGALAIGVGFAEKAGAGPGLVAALISRAMNDSAKLAAVVGADEKTMFGLGGYGDLLSSIALRDRPEVVVGNALAEGDSLEQARKKTPYRIEAIELIPRIVAFSREQKVALPAFEGLQSILLGQGAPSEMLARFLAA